MAAFYFFISGLILCGGILAFAANPRRVTNQLFLLGAIFVAAGAACVAAAIIAGNRYVVDGVTDPRPWIRANAILGHFLIPTLVAIRESIRSPNSDKKSIARVALPWLALSLVPSFIALTNWFIPDDSTHYNRKRGDGYYVSTTISFILFVLVSLKTLNIVKKETGIKRIELKFLVLHSAFSLAAYTAFNALANLTKLFPIKSLILLLLTCAFYSSGWLICHHHIFDLRQAASIVLRYATVFTAVAAVAISTSITAHLWADLHISIAIGIASAGLLFSSIDSFIVRMLHGRSDHQIIRLKNRVIEIARGSANTADLLSHFAILIRSESVASFVNIMIDENQIFRSTKFSIASNSAELKAILPLGWSTPEALHRRRTTPEATKLAALLEANSIGLIISIPIGNRSPSMVIIFGTKREAQPYTYPEIQRHLQLAELMDNIVTRARLTEQAALQAKMEHLAMMSRGLAHDLKNLITPISSYLIHTEGKHPPDTPEAEVHAAARRSVGIMEDYVRDALFFSQRLAPKADPVDIPRLFQSVQIVAAARARARQISLQFQPDYPGPLIGDTVLLQRLLANLVHNAIDASSPGQTVTLTSSLSNKFPALCAFVVTDRGHGIAPEHLEKVFEPYFTTKEFGDEVRGFGLGLTIADKIARLHYGTIRVQSQLGEGTTFTVELPVRPQPSPPPSHRLLLPATDTAIS